jgi:membrane protein implicated in regulation of membrane protease activity
MEGSGLSGATKRVADHARSFVQLELQLALSELKRKIVALALGIGFVAGAALLGILALLLGLAAATAGIATALPVWLSLLVMFGAVLLLTLILAVTGIVLLRRGSKPVPEQAIEEAQLTSEALRNGH